MANDPYNRETMPDSPEEVDWDAVLDELNWGTMKSVEQLGSVFSSVDWGKIPGGSTTLARAEIAFPSHPRIGELQELIKDIALDVLGSLVEQQ